MPVRYWCNAGKQPVNNVAFVGAQLSAGGLQTDFQPAFRRRECNPIVEGLKKLGADPKMWAAHQAHGDAADSIPVAPLSLWTSPHLDFPGCTGPQNKPYNYSPYLLVLSNYHMNVWTLCTEWESWVLVCGHQNSYELSVPKAWFCFLPVIGIILLVILTDNFGFLFALLVMNNLAIYSTLISHKSNFWQFSEGQWIIPNALIWNT